MNVAWILVIILLVSAIGGAANGILVYGGVIAPKTIKKTVDVGGKNVEVKMWVPGVVGQTIIGAISGFLIYCIYSQPALIVGTGVPADLTLYQIAMSILAGLGGSIAINGLIEKKQWQSLAPVLKDKDPKTAQSTAELYAGGSRPFQVMQTLE